MYCKSYPKHDGHLAQPVYNIDSTLSKPQCVILGGVLQETINNTNLVLSSLPADARHSTTGTPLSVKGNIFSELFNSEGI